MTNTPIAGQSSLNEPAIAFDGEKYYMVFVANNDTRDLLFATSSDGLTWTRGPNLNQSSAAGPALGFINNQLTAVFVANNKSRNILYSIFDATNGLWTENVDIGESSKAGVTLFFRPPGPGPQQPSGNLPTLFFVANNDTDDLLETVSASSWPPPSSGG
jgi:hypothetical protein